MTDNLAEVLNTLEVQLNTTSGLAICAKYGKKFNCVEFTTSDDTLQPILISPWMQFEPSEMSDMRLKIAYELARRSITYPRILKEITSLQKRLSSLYDLLDDKNKIESKIYETWGKERSTYGLKQDFTDIENSQWPVELMSNWNSNSSWNTLDSAPKDGTRILWGGTWKLHDPLRGEQEIRIFSWNTIMSDGTGYGWMTDDFRSPEDFSVNWTHWKPLPEFIV